MGEKHFGSLRPIFICSVVAVMFAAACTTPGGPPPTNTTTTLPPAGTYTDYLFDCQAAGAVQVDVPGGVTVDAPATVEGGESFTIEYVIDQIDIPASSPPATINWVGGWNFRFTKPTNATVVGTSVSGGQGYSGDATVTDTGSHLEFAISGTAPALGTVDYPVISVDLVADGPGGSFIETSIGGTSYGDPGLTFASSTNFGLVTTVCYPYAPVPTFSSTEITSVPLQIGVCYTIVDLAESFEYLGPANVLANSLHYPDSPDCSTTPVDNSETSVLSGQADQTAAQATCEGLIPGGFLSSLSILEPMTPAFDSADYWGCFVLGGGGGA